MPSYVPRFSSVEAHELKGGDWLLVGPDAPPFPVPHGLFHALFQVGKPAAGGGRRAAGGGRAKLVRKPRAAKAGKLSDADIGRAVARCLKGEKVSAVVKDFPGLKYHALWVRVKRARQAKPPGAAAPAPAAKKWI